MSFEVVVVLFLLLSVVSSLINKLQQHRRSQELEEREKASRRVKRRRPAPVVVEEEEEIDLSEWDVFKEFEPPKPTPARQEEYRPVQVPRPVHEPRGGEEFREVEGTRPVEEPTGGREFQEVRGTRPVTELPATAPADVPPETTVRSIVSKREIAPTRRRRRRGKVRLNFGRDNIRRAILYHEILGPPRADRDLW
ncbi:MAG: hypothetical protein QGI83_02110 [Candidatus Latescibacteria bacterium]|jgi:hypothetical protein|nr:hypothetical protein [Candidatus Latescibacterota bacterium]